MPKVKRVIFALLLVGCFPLSALDYSPWYEQIYLFRSVVSLSYRSYSSIDSEGESIEQSSDDKIVALSLQATLGQRWSSQAELVAAETATTSFSLGKGALALSYYWLNDAIGDPISCVTGVVGLVHIGDARRDPSFFYQGDVGVEAFLSLGREFGCPIDPVGCFWLSGSMGVADRGDPWSAVQAELEWDCADGQVIAAWCEGYVGFGNQELVPLELFQSYNGVAYRAIDIGGTYSYDVPYLMEIFLGGSYRIYAYNAPQKVWRLFLEIRYPFSL